ncbi:hypothetical protein GBAR_LOCUS16199 [Geodia barretti]|uniref:Uncharacterized protein n=1 Tax=Geodia barretti TaxID=519541 RepID=A0AA35WPT7_GEOBA|nr:hypothetical protein GBAR_LOCUS16199 [Geodia barretti]
MSSTRYLSFEYWTSRESDKRSESRQRGHMERRNRQSLASQRPLFREPPRRPSLLLHPSPLVLRLGK